MINISATQIYNLSLILLKTLLPDFIPFSTKLYTSSLLLFLWLDFMKHVFSAVSSSSAFCSSKKRPFSVFARASCPYNPAPEHGQSARKRCGNMWSTLKSLGSSDIVGFNCTGTTSLHSLLWTCCIRRDDVSALLRHPSDTRQTWDQN